MSLKVDTETLERLERQYPGIGESIRARESTPLPPCTRCGSTDTAEVGCGIVGRSVAFATATTRFTLLANGPRPGAYYCNSCGEFFDGG